MYAARMSPRVFNIPASAPFLRVLIEALRAGKLVPGFPAHRDPLELARATLYLPTRRACRLARKVFFDIGADAVILPHIVALGELDEDELIFAQAATGELAETALRLPDALAPFERRLLLAQLIMTWVKSPELHGAAGTPLVASTPAAAMALADDLARLSDDMITRSVRWEKIDDLVREEQPDLDQYWQLSLRLLQVLREQWPRILDERGVIEPAERRDRLIAAEQARLARSDAPAIAAGSTGSMPATAMLLETIAKHPRGALVLPGLDTALDEASWQALSGDEKRVPAFGHAQFAMQALLKRIGITRAQVTQLEESSPREAFVSEVLRPADTTDRWHTARKSLEAAADQAAAAMMVIEAADDEQEALAVAIVLREAAETDGAKTFRQFWHITLPLLQPVIAVVVLFSTIWTFADFQIVYILTHGGPINATQIFATMAYDVALVAGRIGEGSAISLFLFPALLIVIILMLRYLRKE